MRASAAVVLAEAPAAVTAVSGRAGGAADRLNRAVDAVSADIGVIAIVIEVRDARRKVEEMRCASVNGRWKR